MKVFVTGASGFIGRAVALAFRRSGHEVWGLVRSPEKAGLAARDEVRPVLGDIHRAESYENAAEACAVLVHAASDASDRVVETDRLAIETLLRAGERGSRPKAVLFTSGVWVHGDTGSSLVDETSPLSPPRLVAWRPAHEEMVLRAGHVRGLVIRPGCVYGGQGSLTGGWFEGASQGRLQVVGDGRNRWAMVHLDDVADAYVRAAESGLAGEVFDVVDGSRATVDEMAVAAAGAAGYRGDIEYVPVAEAAKSMADLAECLALDQNVDPGKAERRLGWRPRHRGFVDGVEAYYISWKAHQAA
jgi:nucleoside-diphosphate-sugar epimerase